MKEYKKHYDDDAPESGDSDGDLVPPLDGDDDEETVDDYEDLSDTEIANLIREKLRQRFPDTAFQVSYTDSHGLDILFLGGELVKYGDNLPNSIAEEIQNLVFKVAPILLFPERMRYFN
jgi:hypothetical protein